MWLSLRKDFKHRILEYRQELIRWQNFCIAVEKFHGRGLHYHECGVAFRRCSLVRSNALVIYALSISQGLTSVSLSFGSIKEVPETAEIKKKEKKKEHE